MNPAPPTPATHVPPLGHEAMGGMHEEFSSLLVAASEVPDDKLLSLLNEIAHHCDEHFGQEDRWMSQFGFPGRDCHEQEHRAVLASIGGVIRRVQRGEIACGRTLVSALVGWFPADAQHLDSTLAHSDEQATLGRQAGCFPPRCSPRPHLPTSQLIG